VNGCCKLCVCVCVCVCVCIVSIGVCSRRCRYREREREREEATNLAQDGPASQKAKGTKLGRYSALISVVQRLVDERKLNFRPTFLFPVLSSLGIMNAE